MSSATRSLGIALGRWMVPAVAFALVEGLWQAWRLWEVLLFSHRLGSFSLARRIADYLGIRVAWLAADQHLWVPSLATLIRFLAESIALYGILALVGALLTVAWRLVRGRGPDASWSGATAAALFAFCGATLGIRAVQNWRELGAARFSLGVLAAFVLTAVILGLARWLPKRVAGWLTTPRIVSTLGVAAIVLWCVSLVLSTTSFPTVATSPAPLPADTALPASCSSPSYNVILISIDTLRADHLSGYGYKRPTSPNLDRLASEGVLFENCTSAGAWTVPSHMSLLTSTYTTEHGVIDNHTKLGVLPTTLAEFLQQNGYTTLGVTAAAPVSTLNGFERGFDVFEDPLADQTEERHAEFIADRAIELLDSHAADPFFLFLHFFDPHTTYDPPEPHASLFTAGIEKGRVAPTYAALTPYARTDVQMPASDLDWILALYDGEIHYVDAQIGRLLDYLGANGLRHNTVIAVVSDHGEEFEDHASMFHGFTLYEEMIHVPWIYSAPGAPAGERRTEAVRSIDVAPTLLELAGCSQPATFRGQSVAKKDSARGLRSFSDTALHLQRKMIVADGYKLILSPYDEKLELFDLNGDPGEIEELSRGRPDMVRTLRKELYDWYDHQRSLRAAIKDLGPRDAELTEDDIRRLRALGYLQ